jgi:hypothetical protein
LSDFMVKRKRKTEMRKPATRKGQAVMEYLITYGLALFVILVVLGILFAVILPMLKAPKTCKFSDPGFACDQMEHSLVAAPSNNNVRMLFQLYNTGGKTVVIKDVLCTTASTGNIKAATSFKDALKNVDPNLLTLGSGQTMTFGSVTTTGTPATVTDEIACYKEDGTMVVLTPGSSFRGTLAVLYKNSEEVPGSPDRIATAAVTGDVQAGS